MADAQAPAAAAAEAAVISAHLRAISGKTVTELRQQTGGHAGVVEALAEVAGHFKSSPAPPIPVEDATAVSGGPERLEDSWLYLRAVAVHGGSLIDCICAGIQLDMVGSVVKVRYTELSSRIFRPSYIILQRVRSSVDFVLEELFVQVRTSLVFLLVSSDEVNPCHTSIHAAVVQRYNVTTHTHTASFILHISFYRVTGQSNTTPTGRRLCGNTFT